VLIPESQRVSLTLASTSERELAIRGEIASNLKKMCSCVFKIKRTCLDYVNHIFASFLHWAYRTMCSCVSYLQYMNRKSMYIELKIR